MGTRRKSARRELRFPAGESLEFCILVEYYRESSLVSLGQTKATRQHRSGTLFERRCSAAGRSALSSAFRNLFGLAREKSLTLFSLQVDAHVGKWLFDNAICGSLAGKTRILVTHALHFLPRVDYIVCLENGRISQEGTYSELVADKEGAFSKLMEEFGGEVNETKAEEDAEKEEEAIEAAGKEPKKEEDGGKAKPKGLMQEEERAVGSVSGEGADSVRVHQAAGFH